MAEEREGLLIARARIAEEAERRTGVLDLGGLALRQLPSELFELVHLEELNLGLGTPNTERRFQLYGSRKQVSRHLTQIATLVRLLRLSLADSDVCDLSALASLKSLIWLDCSYTRVSDLGPLQSLTWLQSLNCSCTRVSDLGPLQRLAALQSLDCAATKVTNLDPLQGLAALQSLNCSESRVSDLGPLRGLNALRSLTCSRTLVTQIGALQGLTALQSLDCSQSRVSDLGPLRGLTALHSLNCSLTFVTNLDPLQGVAALRWLDCSLCRLNTNHTEIWFKESLKELFLEQSYVPDVPPEVLSRYFQDNCLDSLRAHLADFAAGPVVVSDVKLFLLGNGRAGKTQIRHRLCSRAFDENWDSTHGVRVASTGLTGEVDTGEIRLHIWDFGGQDVYHGTHALFLRTAAVATLVWARDTENSDEYERDGLRFRNHRLQYWVDLARHQGHAQSPILTVQTKCERAEHEVRRSPVASETIEALPYLKSLHYSARTDRGRAALDEALCDAIEWLRDPTRLGTPMVGAGRQRVRRRLEELRDADAALPVDERRSRTLSQEYFRLLCEEAGGISSPEQLLHYLSNTGTVFYRKGLFGDLIILDQAWVLDAIYAIFQRRRCYRHLLWTRGRFTRAMLELLVWQEHGVEEQKLFLSMMQSCGICFVHRKAGDDTEYVAPDLLPERSTLAAELAEKWPADAVVETATFEYELLHPGLVRDVISRIGSSAAVNALYWRGGVCVYEAVTRSRGLIEQELSATGRGRIRIQAQGGQAAILLQRLAKEVEAAQDRLGLRPTEVMGASAGHGRNHPSIDVPDRDKAKPAMAFIQPPVPEPEWYVSYAWGDGSAEGRDREAVVDRLCDEACSRGIRIQRDKTSLSVGDSITKFMQRIAQGDRVFVILSDKYLRSAFCMFELCELWRTSRQEGAAFLERVRMYALPDAQFDTPVARTRIAIHWKQQHAELEALVREHGTDVVGESDFKRLRLMGAFYRDVSEILATMADIVRPRNFKDLARYGLDDGPTTRS